MAVVGDHPIIFELLKEIGEESNYSLSFGGAWPEALKSQEIPRTDKEISKIVESLTKMKSSRHFVELDGPGGWTPEWYASMTDLHLFATGEETQVREIIKHYDAELADKMADDWFNGDWP